MARIVWTFDSVSFRVRMTGEFDPWFSPSYQYATDLVLASTLSYLDLGAVKYNAIKVRAQFDTSVAREAMIAKLGTTGTLSNTDSRSATATLVEALRVNNASGAAWWLDCTFEYRSS